MTKLDTSDTTAVQERIRALEDLRYEAVLREDYDAFAAMAHPDLVYTHSNGERDSLYSYLEKCRTGAYRYHSIEHPITDILVVGAVAIVIGEMKADITASGVPKRLENTAIAVWVRDGGTWLLLAYQPTPKPAPSTA
ncbi:conserved hypothetical protein [Arthrobacter sp. cf158]|uniref:nuclear transport factor 2 family protein n=1 Tax=Arthrobacter sp. cf158 TaxID=1761744 RepID=UPI0008998112|nr:nuclear transport factor 2 family protein [Arthrobacter sp. cf158]SDW98392.1 conserved hypothetical protein [Arthrobacter sp. cf158]